MSCFMLRTRMGLCIFQAQALNNGGLLMDYAAVFVHTEGYSFRGWVCIESKAPRPTYGKVNPLIGSRVSGILL